MFVMTGILGKKFLKAASKWNGGQAGDSEELGDLGWHALIAKQAPRREIKGGIKG